jgi:chromosome partitioning protein
MTVIALVQWKGGQGKSTLAVHLAAHLERQAVEHGGPGAVLVDLEPWGGATTWWAGTRAAELWQAPSGPPLLNSLARGTAPRPRRGRAGRSRLVPAHEEMLALAGGGVSEFATWAWREDGTPTQMVRTAEGPRPLATALRAALPTWAQQWGSHVVVDTPAGFSALADGAVAAADVVILPVTLDQWSVPPLRRFMRSYADRITAGLVVANRVQAREHDDLWAQVLAAPGVVEPPFILCSTVIPESKLLHTSTRPLALNGRAPSPTRVDVLDRVDEITRQVLELAGTPARAQVQP